MYNFKYVQRLVEEKDFTDVVRMAIIKSFLWNYIWCRISPRPLAFLIFWKVRWLPNILGQRKQITATIQDKHFVVDECVCAMLSHSITSDSLQPHGQAYQAPLSTRQESRVLVRDWFRKPATESNLRERMREEVKPKDWEEPHQVRKWSWLAQIVGIF